MATTTLPAPVTFQMIAEDGWTYPVTVEFLNRLPALRAVGLEGGGMNRDFRDRAGLVLHQVLPRRCRVIVTVDTVEATRDGFPGMRVWQDADRRRAFCRSGAALADQLYAVLSRGL